VPFGLVGARLYHVITDYQNYFGEGKHPIDALKVWHGGLGIWGAVAFGALGAWIGCRRNGIKMPAMADSLAPGVVLAQAMGRWGNWFNQELFGRPTSLPWGLEIDVAHRPSGYLAQATYQPTFLYESLWCIGVAILCIWADRRFTLGHGVLVTVLSPATTKVTSSSRAPSTSPASGSGYATPSNPIRGTRPSLSACRKTRWTPRCRT